MTATATSASIRFGDGGTARVQCYVRLTASTNIHCYAYAAAAPILTIQDGPADITITNPGKGEVTQEDITFGRMLAEAVNRYVAELEKLAPQARQAAEPDQPPGRAA